MSHSARDRLAVLLAERIGAEVFSAALTAPTGDLHLEVRGVGPIKLPVSQTQARQLCVLGRPARYGRGEQTLLDRDVRDTWEIPKSRVKIDKRRWNETLQPVLERLGRGAGAYLRARAAGGAALDAGVWTRAVLPRAPRFREGRRDGRLARGRSARDLQGRRA